MLETVAKAGRVLDLFTPERPEWGVSEAAAALGMPKSGTHALLSTLVVTGLIERTGRGRYRLGWRVFSLNRTLLAGATFEEAARRRMALLTQRFGRTVHLAALDHNRVVYLAKSEGPGALPISLSDVGRRLHAHATGVGKVLLAFRGPDHVARVAQEHGLPSSTPRTITSVDRLQRHLEGVRARGFAHDLEEGLENLCCVAAPIYGSDGVVQAAMSISVPMGWFRQDPGRYRDIIVAAAGDVSRQQGFRAGAAPA